MQVFSHEKVQVSATMAAPTSMVSPEGTQDGDNQPAHCEAHIVVSLCSHPDGASEETHNASPRELKCVSQE